jgi:hypothetical protein
VKLAPIAPNAHIPFGQDYILTVPWAAQFYEQSSGYKILDNGAYEIGSPVEPLSWLYQIAHQYSFDEIVVPDMPLDAEQTLKQAKHWVYDLRFSHMAVAQGNTVDQVVWCAKQLAGFQSVDCIGISKLLPTTSGDLLSRVAVVHNLCHSIGKPVHILGSSPWIREVFALKRYPNVRGIDTSLPYVTAMTTFLTIDKMPHMWECVRRHNYFDVLMTQAEVLTAENNISIMEDWVS